MKFMRASAVLLTGLMLAGCAEAHAASKDTRELSMMRNEPLLEMVLTEDELREEYDADSAVSIRFLEEDVDIEGEGAYCQEGILMIQQAGTYVLCGEADEAGIEVNCSSNEAVRLVLNGIRLSSSQGPVLYVNNGSKVILTAVPASENILKSTAAEPITATAAVISETDLVINGGGSLEIVSEKGEGIQAQGSVKLLDVMVSIQAGTDGIRAGDLIGGLDCILNVKAQANGLWAGYETTEGEILFPSGVLTVHAGDAGIIAEGDISTAGSELYVSEGTNQ